MRAVERGAESTHRPPPHYPTTPPQVLCSKNLADCFNISLYDMHVELKCIPFVDHEPPEAEEEAKHSNGNLDVCRFRQSRAEYNPIHGDGERYLKDANTRSVEPDTPPTLLHIHACTLTIQRSSKLTSMLKHKSHVPIQILRLCNVWNPR